MQSVVGNKIDVEGILPQNVIDQAESLLKEIYLTKMREGNIFEENKPFYTYHVYDFIRKNLMIDCYIFYNIL